MRTDYPKNASHWTGRRCKEEDREHEHAKCIDRCVEQPTMPIKAEKRKVPTRDGNPEPIKIYVAGRCVRPMMGSQRSSR